MGYKVIYSDTDSVFVETNLGKAEAKKLGKKIEEHINKFYDSYVQKKYKLILVLTYILRYNF